MDKNESLYNYGFYISIGFMILDVYFSVVLAQNIGERYYLMLISVPFLIALAIYFRRGFKKAKCLNFIKREWGTKQKRKRNFKTISEFHKLVSELDRSKFYIDDQTWQDLTMDEVYEILDRTLSKTGEHALYNLLRTPSFDEAEIKKRSVIIDFFRNNANVREKFQYAFYNLGREKNNGVITLLWGKEIPVIKANIFFYIMSGMAVVSIISLPVLGLGVGALLIVTMFFCNFAIHGLSKRVISGDIPSIGRIGGMIKTAQVIKGIEEPVLKEKMDALKKSYNACSYISKRTMSLGRVEGIDIITDYFSIFFLLDEVSYFSAIKGINKYREELRNIYSILGELDAYISLASYRDELVNFVEPEFTYSGPKIEVVDGRHPLIVEAVPNTIRLTRGGIILTGSNMSGKSTFLRMLGVNALLAQTISTCLATSYKASLLKVLTSISPSDNIMGGKSYYLGEAEALLRIIKSSEDNIPSLCMIDEIFRGTNPVERVSAAAEILDYLPDHNAMTIAATHDIELTEMVKNHYECYYFTEDVGERGLIFDYKIRKGISKTRNAIKVLKFLGYPDEIIDKANERLNHI
ncbi:MAG: DNA mismatch repair protein MutS [Clostridiaceae bacterium]|nr:DNA mismatch repair protein MutS [Clostridiaceae bacterium]